MRGKEVKKEGNDPFNGKSVQCPILTRHRHKSLHLVIIFPQTITDVCYVRCSCTLPLLLVNFVFDII